MYWMLWWWCCSGLDSCLNVLRILTVWLSQPLTLLNNRFLFFLFILLVVYELVMPQLGSSEQFANNILKLTWSSIDFKPLNGLATVISVVMASFQNERQRWPLQDGWSRSPQCLLYVDLYQCRSADPEFSWGEGTNSQVGVILQIFCRRLHANERIWTRGTRPCLPLDPPMQCNDFSSV